ncbi:oligosaccharide flippase family protein [Lyngbya aestuarii]|uniref:oligosaccharide flippase family protein n=1 Tax=Lyngbya aestuarii TaxID=118322 RepID=UPI00403DD128
MNLIEKTRSWVKKKSANNFIRNLGWLTVAQALNRVSRLATTVIIARYLTREDFGLAALVTTTYDFTRILTSFGIGAKIIRAEESEIEDICNGAYWLNWLMFLILFVVQCLLAFGVAWFYDNNRLILPILILSFVYLMSPFGRIQSILIQKENRLKITALSQFLTITTSNIVTAILALFGMGLWAIVLPKLITPFIEVYVYLNNHTWRPSGGFTTKYWREIYQFGIKILGINFLRLLRENLDYLIIGKFLGVEVLGVYYFAFNAGLGISLTIIQSITVALYPHLCAARTNLVKFKQTYFKSLKTIAMIIIPCVLLQSSLAPFYVPIIFGEKWVAAGAIPILILICLSAIPRPFESASAQLLAAIDRPDISLRWSLLFTGIFAIAIVIGMQWQIVGVAAAVLITHLVAVPIFVILSTWYVFYRKAKLS